MILELLWYALPEQCMCQIDGANLAMMQARRPINQASAPASGCSKRVFAFLNGSRGLPYVLRHTGSIDYCQPLAHS